MHSGLFPHSHFGKKNRSSYMKFYNMSLIAQESGSSLKIPKVSFSTACCWCSLVARQGCPIDTTQITACTPGAAEIAEHVMGLRQTNPETWQHFLVLNSPETSLLPNKLTSCPKYTFSSNLGDKALCIQEMRHSGARFLKLLSLHSQITQLSCTATGNGLAWSWTSDKLCTWPFFNL